jgi:DNA-binding transcriptional LysR family regulator
MAKLDPNDLADLVALARAGSFQAAAKRRGIAGSTLSRRLAALEKSLGVALVDRRADGSRLTEQGTTLAALSAPLDDQLARIVRAAEALRAGISSLPVRVSATEFVVSDVLAPALPTLWRNNSGIAVDLRSQRDVVSLAGRDADLAVRMSRPEGASLLAKRLPALRLGLFASRDYLGGRTPESIDLNDQRLLVYDDSYGRLPELAWLSRAGLDNAVRMRTASTRGLLTACLAGAGVALLPAVFGIRDPTLVEIPLPAPLPPREPWLVVHPDVSRHPNVRAVHRWIVAAFAALDVKG